MSSFQRARKADQINKRRKEILDAANALFDEGGFENTSFSHIAKRVSFTRQTIYTYYHTREEVLLDLLCEQLQCFYREVDEMFPCERHVTQKEFCSLLATHFIRHKKTLQLFSLHHTVLSMNVRYENLLKFNRVMLQAFPAVDRILSYQCPDTSHDVFNQFTATMIPFMSSLYPIIEPHPLQLKAIYEVVPKGSYIPTQEECLRSSLMLMSSALRFAADAENENAAEKA